MFSITGKVSFCFMLFLWVGHSTIDYHFNGFAGSTDFVGKAFDYKLHTGSHISDFPYNKSNHLMLYLESILNIL
jgi:hypothetical protein